MNNYFNQVQWGFSALFEARYEVENESHIIIIIKQGVLKQLMWSLKVLGNVISYYCWKWIPFFQWWQSNTEMQNYYYWSIRWNYSLTTAQPPPIFIHLDFLCWVIYCGIVRFGNWISTGVVHSDEMGSVSKLQKMMDTPAEPTKNLNSNESLFKKGRTGSTFHIRHPHYSVGVSRIVCLTQLYMYLINWLALYSMNMRRQYVE